MITKYELKMTCKIPIDNPDFGTSLYNEFKIWLQSWSKDITITGEITQALTPHNIIKKEHSHVQKNP